MTQHDGQIVVRAVVLYFGLAVSLLVPGCRDTSASHYDRGRAHLRQDEYDLAIEELTKAIAADPRYSEAYIVRAAAYDAKGEYGRAISDCSEAIELDDDPRMAYACRGRVHWHEGQLDKAIADCSRAIEIDPNFGAPSCDRGHAYLEKGDYVPAIADFNKAIGAIPDYGLAYWGRARESAGTSSAISSTITEITTSSSISVKAFLVLTILCPWPPASSTIPKPCGLEAATQLESVIRKGISSP